MGCKPVAVVSNCNDNADRFKGLHPWRGRVRLTAKGVEHLVSGHHASKLRADSQGSVTGVGRDANTIRVLVDGYSTIGTYHTDFWEPI